MVNPMNKDTRHQGPMYVTEGYLEYAKENDKGRVNQHDVGNKKHQQSSTTVVTI